jgi:hypothetical protein
MDASGIKPPSIIRCVGLKASAYQHAMSDLGIVTRDFMWRTPATWGQNCRREHKGEFLTGVKPLKPHFR